MTRYYTCHWQKKFWNPEANTPYEPIKAAGSNRFTQRGVAAEDIVYIVSIADGQLYLGGKMQISRIVPRSTAMKITGNQRLYDAAEFVIDTKGGTPLNLLRRLAPEVTEQIECILANGTPKTLCFVDDNKMNLDVQATRGVRELTKKSAELLDLIIDVTDARPRSTSLLTVTNSMLKRRR